MSPSCAFSQLSSTKPYLRKKAVLLMYKIFLKFPEALRPAFPRLKDKLDDPDPGEAEEGVGDVGRRWWCDGVVGC